MRGPITFSRPTHQGRPLHPDALECHSHWFMDGRMFAITDEDDGAKIDLFARYYGARIIQTHRNWGCRG